MSRPSFIHFEVQHCLPNLCCFGAPEIRTAEDAPRDESTYEENYLPT
jgi:hypothetical protein